jgi:hypothetical protein
MWYEWYAGGILTGIGLGVGSATMFIRYLYRHPHIIMAGVMKMVANKQ